MKPQRTLAILVFLSANVVQASAAQPLDPGDLLFLSGEIESCGQGTRVFDYAEVSAERAADFSNDIKVDLAGVPRHRVGARVAEAIAQSQEKRPKSLLVSIVKATSRKTAVEFMSRLVDDRQDPCLVEEAEAPIDEDATEQSRDRARKWIEHIDKELERRKGPAYDPLDLPPLRKLDVV